MTEEFYSIQRSEKKQILKKGSWNLQEITKQTFTFIFQVYIMRVSDIQVKYGKMKSVLGEITAKKVKM